MKNLGRLMTAVVLTLVLWMPASAGYISTGVVDPPPPPPAPTAAAAGETNAGGGDETSAALTGVWLTMSELMLALF